MSEPRMRIFATLEEASRALAAEIARALAGAVAERGRATIALAGGGTPRTCYEALAAEHSGLPWPRTHVSWGDERFARHDSPESNYRMARETLLEAVPIPPENVHPWATQMERPEQAAAAYEADLAALFGGALPRFDTMLLGLGEDGHTASLFPGSPALRIEDRWAVPSEAPAEPRRRLTLTLPVINNARAVHFLVAGAGKREAVRCARSGGHPERCPAALVRPKSGTLTWWLDNAAGLTETAPNGRANDPRA